MNESIFDKLGVFLNNIIRILCPALHITIFSEYHERKFLKIFLSFIAGFLLGQAYFHLFLEDIPFLSVNGFVISILISIILGKPVQHE